MRLHGIDLLEFFICIYFPCLCGVRVYFVGFIFPAVFLISTGYVNCNASLAVALIIVGVGLSGISTSGFLVNHLDLAPPYAGLCLSFSLVNFRSISI